MYSRGGRGGWSFFVTSPKRNRLRVVFGYNDNPCGGRGGVLFIVYCGMGIENDEGGRWKKTVFRENMYFFYLLDKNIPVI